MKSALEVLCEIYETDENGLIDCLYSDLSDGDIERILDGMKQYAESYGIECIEMAREEEDFDFDLPEHKS